MRKYYNKSIELFDKLILGHPVITIVLFLAMIAFFSFHAADFRIDASAETLLNENSKELKFYRAVARKYESKDFIVITYKPIKDDLFSKNILSNIKNLSNEVKKIKNVDGVISILDVPLIETAHKMKIDITKKIPTLEDPRIDINLAKEEFKNSPLYKNLIVSPDLKATAIEVIFKQNKNYDRLIEERQKLIDKKHSSKLTPAEKKRYKELNKKIRKELDRINDQRHRDILKIREIVKKYQNNAKIILGGVPIIADDLILFIKNDLEVFGIGVFIFMLITLIYSFRKIRWIVLPMLCCAFAVTVMMGILGMFDWEVTVISSNFVSLQLILTMAIAIHLIVRYEEFNLIHPEISHRKLIKNTIQDKFIPCLYTTITTIVGFSSLLLCNLKPVRTFGWMMSVGLIISLLLTFIFFPAQVMLLKKSAPMKNRESFFAFLTKVPKIIASREKYIIIISVIVIILSFIGISRLQVENSFIDYFKHTTEIYQGLKFIDRNLGGTTPFDVILKFKENKNNKMEVESSIDNSQDDMFEELEETTETKKTGPEYWFTVDKIDLIKKVHNYLSELPHIGKVLSLATFIQIAEKLNNGRELDNFELALLYKELPKKAKDMIIKPYVSIKDNEAHIVARVKDSDKDLRRNELLKKIKNDFVKKLHIEKDQFHITGILVLYNQILQSLFKSQILTLGYTAILLFVMFLLLLRSLKVSLLAIFPNVFPVFFILGFMGWNNIHLDMMTITIAAISMGIAVDNTIHYIHRFHQEFRIIGNYKETMFKCGQTIAFAMFYTTLVITVGFSILVFSNFIPTIYFGLLTGITMIIALLADLFLLPALIVTFKPFGPEK